MKTVELETAKFNIYSSSMDCYSNYEECLETALKEALNLIK